MPSRPPSPSSRQDPPFDAGVLTAAARDLAAEALTRLRRYVEHETPTGDAAALDALADVLAARYAELGATVERVAEPTGDHLVARWEAAADADRGDGRHLLLLGHHDTVWPVGQLAGPMPWVCDDGAGDVVKGPGVFDDKGGLVVAETALAILARTGLGPRRPVCLVVAADEEIGSPTARAVVERLLPDTVAAFGLEPPHPDGALKTGRHGSTRVRLEVHGVSAHAALDPGRGVSANDELVDQLVGVREIVASAPGVLCNVGILRGGERTNVTAGKAHADLGLRFPDAAAEHRVLAALDRLTPVRRGARVAVTTLTSRPAWSSAPETDATGLLAAVRAAAAPLGHHVEGRPARGAADTNLAGSAGVPTLDGFGPVGRGAHALHEHIRASSLPERAALLAAVLAT